MEKSFFEYFKGHKFLSIEDLQTLFKIVTIKKVKSGDLLIRQGEVFPYALFVRKGLIRSFVITSNGEDRSVYFFSEGSAIASPESISLGLPAIESVEALEDCTIIYLDSRKFSKLAKKRPALLRLKIKNMEKAIITTMNRVRFFAINSPEERFIILRDENPELIQRIPQKYLASFIGVTTVSLSRIKSRISQNKK